MYRFLIGCFSILSFSSYSSDYYWVGNTGNWSDLSHWASSSGGAGNAYISLPSSSDNAYFDANSFSSGSQTTTVDVDAACADLSFTGVTNSPTFAGVSTQTMSVSGSLTLVSGMTHSFAGDYDFLGTGSHTLTSGGKTLNQNILFNGIGGTWTLTDALTVTGEVGLQNGTFDMAAFSVESGSINANYGTNARSIDFGGSIVTITGTGTVLDLRGNTTNLTVTPAGSTITFTNASDITIESGDEVKTLPNMTFPNCATSIRINTGSVEDNTKRITFGNIVAAIDGVSFRVDDNSDDNNIKTFGAITLPNDCRYIIGSGDGTGGFSGTNHTIISGGFTVGNNGEGDVRGSFIEFQGDFIAGTDSDCRFVRPVQFVTDFEVQSTSGNDIIIDNRGLFNGNIDVNGDSRFRFDGNVDVTGDINVASNADLTIDNNVSSNTTINGNVSLGSKSTADFGDGDDGPFTFNTISLATESEIDFNNNSSATTITDLMLSSFNIVRFNASGTNSITGTFTAPGTCKEWLNLKSTINGTQASVSFSSSQTISHNVIQDINCTSSNLDDVNGVDLNNNTNITFTSGIAGQTLYWVGSTTGNTKMGTNSTGVNDNWSNPDNWSTTSGSYTGTNSCIPDAQDNVVFDANSFSAGAGTCDLDLSTQLCNDMTWTGIPASSTFDNGLTTNSRNLLVYGNLTLHANLDNQFEGTVEFTAIDGTTRTITSNGSNMYGGVRFDRSGATWSLADNFDMNGEANADVTFQNGTINANAVTWTIEDDWTINAGATFSAGTSTIEFDGPSANTSSQSIDPNGNAFYNFTVNRGSNSDECRLAAATNINNNLTITTGELEDRGNQITGAVAGNTTMASNTILRLSHNATATEFPTNYVNANISLHSRSRVYYSAESAQLVSGEPDYGRLYISNSDGTMVNKTLQGPINISRLLRIENNNNFIDNGHQITGTASREIQMDANSQLTLGTAGSATEFPTAFTTIDLNEPNTVVYNSGLNQDVKSISGTDDEQYSNVTLSNAAGVGTSIKSLIGSVKIRGDLSIGADTELDVDVTNDYTIEIAGNWNNDGAFDEHEGVVSFNGSSTQTITAGGSQESFYDFAIANSGAGVSLGDDVMITNQLTLTTGDIASTSSNILTMAAGSSHASSSNSSHVTGPMEKIGGTGFTFPIGDGTTLHPIITANLSGSVTFTAEYSGSVHPDTDVEAALSHVSKMEYWDLSPSVGVTTDITLPWTTRAAHGIGTDAAAEADLTVAHYDGSDWDEPDGTPTISWADPGSVTIENISTFSPFTFGSRSGGGSVNPLPIELLQFEAVKNGNHTDIYWTTASETNNDFFTIERSQDGKHFEELLFVSGAGNSTNEIDYMEKDYDPYGGVSYYRLKQTDYDGTYTYSQIVAIKFMERHLKQMAVYPNPLPLNSKLNIALEGFENDEEILVIVRDISGKELYSKVIITHTNQNTVTAIDSSQNLPLGIYTITGTTSKEIFSKKLIIQ